MKLALVTQLAMGQVSPQANETKRPKLAVGASWLLAGLTCLNEA
jgi:hypothetical protein